MKKTKIKKGIDFKQFRDTGRFKPAERYKEEYPKHKLSDDTVEVVVYVGGYLIEVRKPDIFFFDGHQSNVLDDIEKVLWEKKVVKDLNIK